MCKTCYVLQVQGPRRRQVVPPVLQRSGEGRSGCASAGACIGTSQSCLVRRQGACSCEKCWEALRSEDSRLEGVFDEISKWLEGCKREVCE